MHTASIQRMHSLSWWQRRCRARYKFSVIAKAEEVARNGEVYAGAYRSLAQIVHRVLNARFLWNRSTICTGLPVYWSPMRMALMLTPKLAGVTELAVCPSQISILKAKSRDGWRERPSKWGQQRIGRPYALCKALKENSKVDSEVDMRLMIAKSYRLSFHCKY